MRFVVTRGKRRKRNQFRFNLLADNNEVIATSESYYNKTDLLDTIDLIRGYAVHATLEDKT